MTKRLYFLLSLMLGAGLSYADRAFDESVRSFQTADYAVAGHYLEQYLAENGNNIDVDRERIDYMKLVILENVDSFKHIKPAEQFLETYPNSIYRNSIVSYLGSAYHVNGQYAKAVECFGECDVEHLDLRDCTRSLLHNAVSNIELDSLEKAIVLLNTLNFLDKRYQQHVNYYIGYIAYKVKDYELSKEYLDSVKHNPTYYVSSYLYLAEIALVTRDFDMAIEHALRVLQSKADASIMLQANRIIGQALFQKKQYKESLDIMEPYMSSISTPDRTDYYTTGMDYFHIAEYSKAIDQLQHVTLTEDRMAENAFLHIGLAALKLKDMNQAELAFQLGSGINADLAVSEQLLYNYAMTLYETSFSPFSDAVTVFEQFINKYPNSKYIAKASSCLIDVYENSTNYSSAITSIEKLKNPPANVMRSKQLLYFRRGNEYYGAGQYDKAKADYTQAIKLKQYDKEVTEKAYFWRGEANFRQDQFSQARQDYQSAIDGTVDVYGTDYMMSVYGRAYAAYKMRNFEQAREEWYSMLHHPSMPSMSKTIQSDVNARVADCYFAIKKYSEASGYYLKALALDTSNGDYILYQLALLSGLTRDYESKASYMNRLTKEYPNSTMRLSAMYEQARTYQQMDRGQDAISLFESIVKEAPSSQMAAKSLLETAHIYNQLEKSSRAIDTYEKVVKNYPGSQESKTALKDLRNLYVDLGRVNDYVKFTNSVEGVVPIAANELDSLSYISAERNFTRGNYKTAQKAFQDYLTQYKNGQYVTNAHYYLGRIAERDKKNSDALEHYALAARNKHHSFGQEAMQQAAALAYSLGKYDLALNNYRDLYELLNGTKRNEALYGVIRSAYRMKEYAVVLDYADIALNGSVKDELRLEMLYYKSKSTIELSGLADAVPFIEELAKDTRTEYGAEGNFLYCSYLYDYALYAKCNEVIMKFVQSGSTQQYWIARCLILLSDSYYAQGKQIEAKQYLLSLKQNYKVKNDDIQSLIQTRLDKIEARGDSLMQQ